jgi:hypothetical protein
MIRRQEYSIGRAAAPAAFAGVSATGEFSLELSALGLRA